MFSQQNGDLKRTLIRYYKPSYNSIRLYKYLLVETVNEESWKSVYLVSTQLLNQELNLFSINFIGNEVINIDNLLHGEQDYLVNGVKIGGKNFDLNSKIVYPERRGEEMNPACGEEVCFDSWLVTYNVETGQVLWTEFSPICKIVQCGGGGGGNPVNPPTVNCDDPNLYADEKREFDNYVEIGPITPVNITAKFFGNNLGDRYFDGIHSWTVAEGFYGLWKVKSTFQYGYTRHAIGNVFNDNIEYYYTFDKLKTIATDIYGSMLIITNTFSGTSIDNVYDNGTAYARGKVDVVGKIHFEMGFIAINPNCSPLNLYRDIPVENYCNFKPR